MRNCIMFTSFFLGSSKNQISNVLRNEHFPENAHSSSIFVRAAIKHTFENEWPNKWMTENQKRRKYLLSNIAVHFSRRLSVFQIKSEFPSYLFRTRRPPIDDTVWKETPARSRPSSVIVWTFMARTCRLRGD